MTEQSHVSENDDGQLVLSDEGEVVSSLPTDGINMANLKRFAELSKNKKRMDADLKTTSEELKKLEANILKDFEAFGIGNMNVDGMTIYTHEQIWASAKDKDAERACSVLKEQGLGDFVKESFNVQTVSAWVRERLNAVKDSENAAYAALERGDKIAYDLHMKLAKMEDIPEAVKEVLKISEVPSVRAKKS